MPAQHTRSTGVLCGRPVALELSTRQLERYGSWQRQLQTSAEDAFIYTVVKHLERFRTIRSTNGLTYLLGAFYLRSRRCLHTDNNLRLSGQRINVQLLSKPFHATRQISDSAIVACKNFTLTLMQPNSARANVLSLWTSRDFVRQTHYRAGSMPYAWFLALCIRSSVAVSPLSVAKEIRLSVRIP